MPHVLILLASYNHTVTDCAIKRLMSSDPKYLALLEKFLVNTFFGYKEVGKLFERIKNDKINWIKKNGELGTDFPPTQTPTQNPEFHLETSLKNLKFKSCNL